MAALTKFYSFVTETAAGTHVNAINASSDTLNIFLTNDTPTLTYETYGGVGASAGTALGGIDGTNINETYPQDIVNTTATVTGTITVSGSDLNFTATGVVPTFRYAVLYNDTAASDELIGYWDNGSAVDLTSGQVFTVNLDTQVLFTVS